MTTTAPRQIIVIGAGIIGTATALRLQRAGHRVRLIDRRGVAAETSRGNAGAFAFTDIEPLATPGIMKKAPRWLLDPLGPLSLRPGYALKMLPWLWQFWRASRPSRFEAAVAAQVALMEHSRAALERLIAETKGEALIRREGQLQLYEGAAEFRAALPAWELRRQHAIPFTFLENPEAIAEIQPGLNPRFTHAGFTPTWMNTVDPALWTQHLADQFIAGGGVYETVEILGIAAAGDGVRIQTAGGAIHADHVVVAAGAWSHRLARALGDHIPLDTERGYNTTFPAASFDLRTHLTFSGHGFVVSRIQNGLRVGGAVELGGLTLPPNFRRSEILVEKTRTFLTDFDPGPGEQWMGFRPSLPDSLPVIGASPRCAKVIYAFGHGHLGLTQSAGTAELVEGLIAGRPSPILLTAFRADRFTNP